MATQTPTSIFLISGRYFDTMNPDPRDVTAWDIAWSLSLINRFVGHTLTPWSVLDHTGLCYSLAYAETKGALNEYDKIGILLHDAAEMVLGDMNRPLKSAMAEYRAAESRVMTAILSRFNVNPDKVNWDLVKQYDNQALWVEMNHLRQHVDIPPVYEMKDVPKLVKARPDQYIALLKDCAINMNAADLKDLFELPDYLARAMHTVPTFGQQQQRELPHNFAQSRQLMGDVDAITRNNGFVDVDKARASLTPEQVRMQSSQNFREQDAYAEVAAAVPQRDDLYRTGI
jgi:hypothetical protein